MYSLFPFVLASTLRAFLLVGLLSVMGLLGMWGALQFTWFVKENADVAAGAERALFAVLVPVAAATLTWATVTLGDFIDAMPHVLALVTTALLWCVV